MDANSKQRCVLLEPIIYYNHTLQNNNGYFIGSDVHILFPENSKRKIKHVNYFIIPCILNYYA